MRMLEILLVVSTFLTLFQCAFFSAKKPSYLSMILPLGVVLIIFLHAWVEKVRWQMVPAYAIAGVSIVWAAAQIAFYRPRAKALWLHILHEFITILGTLLAFLLLGAAAALSIFAPIFQIPSPSGPFSIGTQDLHLVDTSRPELFTDDPDDHRQLLVRVWYPAEPTTGEALQAYWPEVKHGGPLLLKQLGLPTFLLDYMALIPSHSYGNAAIAPASSKYPVLVFSHGYTDDLSGQLTVMEELASHGYVIFAISHPYEALITEFPDGQIILVDPRAFSMPHLSESRQINLDEQFGTWVKDTYFVLNKLEEMNADQTDSPFSGHLDLQKIGIFGYSFGGATAVEVCLLDRRCQAGANMDGSQFGYVDFSLNHLKVPFLFFYSENSAGMNDYIYSAVENWAYRVTVKGTTHFNFTDKVLWSPYLHYVDSYIPYGLGPLAAQRMIEIKRAYLLAFFDRHLKGKAAPLLDGSSVSFPEVDFKFRIPSE